MRETAGHDDRVDTLGRVVAVPEQLGRAAELLDRVLDVELAVGAREEDDADARGHEMTTSYASITGLARRRSHISLHLRARGLGVGRVDDELDRLADVHLRDVRVAERGQRPLDRRAGRIGDPRPVGDLDVRVNAGMTSDATDQSSAPYQSENARSVTSS